MQRNCSLARISTGIQWQESVPAHWKPMRLKDAVEGCSNGIWGDESKGDGNDTPIIRVADFDRLNRRVFPHQTVRSVPFDQRSSRELLPGDLLIEKSGGGELQPVGMVVEYQGEAGSVCSNFVARMRPRHFASGRFLTYLHAHLYDRSLTKLSIKQSTGIQNLDSGAYLAERCFLPPLVEQLAIASYLDAETARIDALIEEKQRLIDLLLELRGGVIRERTAGLDRAVVRNETGNQFMPTLPEGWMLVGLGRYASITNGSTPLKDNAAFWEGGTYPWLNSAVVNRDEVTEGSELVTVEALRLCHLPIVPAGSVLVALTGQGKTRGQATVLRIEATINQHLAAVVCDDDHLHGEFLFWVLTGQYAALRMVSDGQGGTKGALTCDELGRFPIPKPPISQQRLIAKALYEETRRIDGLIEHVGNEVAVLQELRSSTITDAVLGRLDVRPT